MWIQYGRLEGSCTKRNRFPQSRLDRVGLVEQGGWFTWVPNDLHFEKLEIIAFHDSHFTLQGESHLNFKPFSSEVLISKSILKQT